MVPHIGIVWRFDRYEISARSGYFELGTGNARLGKRNDLLDPRRKGHIDHGDPCPKVDVNVIHSRMIMINVNTAG